MSPADVLRMAREAGLTDGIELPDEVAAVERFAALLTADARTARIAAQAENELLKARLAASGVAERRAVHKAVKDERELCAGVCEQLQAPESCSGAERSLWDVATLACADAILARGAA